MKKILLFVFCLALAGCDTKKHDNIQDNPIQQTGTEITNGTGASTGNVEATKEEKPLLIGQSTGDAKNTLIDFYNNLNDKDFKKALGHMDEGMLKIAAVGDYFNETRLNRFIGALDGGMTLKNIIQTPENLIHDPSKNYQAKFNYDLIYGMGGTLYVETRDMTVKFDSAKNSFSITSLICQKNCGRYPFFNLDKFGIK